MQAKLRVCAVSYLNTAPLVWGLMHGPQQGLLDLEFALPSACAEKLRTGETDVGLVPIIELARQPDLKVVPGSGICCRGRVRSIVLVCKKPLSAVGSIAADTGSRTSVALAQILLARAHGNHPKLIPHRPDLDSMLEIADAALVIGDPALRIDPALASWRGHPVHVFDLGAEWTEMTGQPMVFAVWAARQPGASRGLAETLAASAAYGRERIPQIAAAEGPRLGLAPEAVSEYRSEFIRYDLGPPERAAIRHFLSLAAEDRLVPAVPAVQYAPAPVAAHSLNQP